MQKAKMLYINNTKQNTKVVKFRTDNGKYKKKKVHKTQWKKNTGMKKNESEELI